MLVPACDLYLSTHADSGAGQDEEGDGGEVGGHVERGGYLEDHASQLRGKHVEGERVGLGNLG